MKNKYQVIAVILITFFLIAFFLSIYITVEEKMPQNTVLVITLENKLYHSIHFDYVCMENKTAKITTLKDAAAKGFSPDPHCQELGYFRGNTRFFFHHLLAKLGIDINSRWDKYGNWLW